MLITVPEEGFQIEKSSPGYVRAAKPEDLNAIHDLEQRLHGISRPRDLEYFIKNEPKLWKTFVYFDEMGLSWLFKQHLSPSFKKWLAQSHGERRDLQTTCLPHLLNQYPAKLL